jgi:hypothetical protein
LKLARVDADVLDWIRRVEGVCAALSRYPISPAPRKSVTNSKREPLHENRNGHDEGFRLISATASDEGRPAGRASACRIPEGQRTRTASARGRSPRPNTISAGAIGGDADDVSSRELKLPARICIFDPTALDC